MPKQTKPQAPGHRKGTMCRQAQVNQRCLSHAVPGARAGLLGSSSRALAVFLSERKIVGEAALLDMSLNLRDLPFQAPGPGFQLPGQARVSKLRWFVSCESIFFRSRLSDI